MLTKVDKEHVIQAVLDNDKKFGSYSIQSKKSLESYCLGGDKIQLTSQKDNYNHTEENKQQRDNGGTSKKGMGFRFQIWHNLESGENIREIPIWRMF